jgi:hypothetical protein
VREFVRADQGFTAELWNEEFNGVPIEVVVNGQNAKDAALIQEENNALRNQRTTLLTLIRGKVEEWEEQSCRTINIADIDSLRDKVQAGKQLLSEIERTG